MLLCLLLYCRHFLLSFVKLLIFAECIWTRIAKPNHQQNKHSYVCAFIISLYARIFSTIELWSWFNWMGANPYIHYLPFWESWFEGNIRERGRLSLLKPKPFSTLGWNFYVPNIDFATLSSFFADLSFPHLLLLFTINRLIYEKLGNVLL